ncbi:MULTISPECIES: 23S rRNA (uracil(747)-C(5))-methyltransferase RlmC [Providencia]|uniref:23S rRNA (uracil(747)-C(5))-methyltransferase RlmC n=1 Tax=Providencia huaxiensis TaxID=2027290 RepID=A0ABU2IZQ1_9GAMM|nr:MULTISPECIES: 23S rRNA (uracil(747)-C(5))-methyltransferase RlmC [Providencia]MBZ3681140.1 23S rRNA (uracil(747)-C(5))-methyltransferase RlmC [Providencia rettgeri]AXH62269.1 23S rRNA (uracil(747)-C(5))-methyltransferase RlmC [Providencia huaxiensis]MDT0134546.1 23S rRNA (uracil(747)-C(5))-methyltransferase RlmC [Providencia huaxiensis]MDT1980951.1 23S rRNA (uracil(747)-C(5))-methyltransferase RlmC [Providencia huaxiensis]QLR00279.1 23S rRNA (uracil(747)-C(5))-methyltransferase RlmC [Provid
MHCEKYAAGQCHSCQWLTLTPEQQVIEKQSQLQALLPAIDISLFQPPATGPLMAFRNKAKMVVSGSVEKPILGIVGRDGQGVDLTDCPLYPDAFSDVFSAIIPFIARAGLTPYNIERKRGELKYLLLTQSHYSGKFMLRFVLRSEKKIEQLKKALPWLQEQLPLLAVITANIQPVHMAILEGEDEIFLTEQRTLREEFNQVPLFIRPQGFFQTNPIVAAKLYQTAREWVKALDIDSLWDLFCGVGGFGLHCAEKDTHLTGIEISAPAIASAQQSADELGLKHVEFKALDSTRFATANQDIPQLILVNPPRRGIGKELCDFLSHVQPEYILYSSCNAQTMAQDLQLLAGYQVCKVQLFDLFPHTAHFEVLTLLKRIVQ